MLSLYQWIFSQLISTSNINFETYKVLGIEYVQYCRICISFSSSAGSGFLFVKNISKL